MWKGIKFLFRVILIAAGWAVLVSILWVGVLRFANPPVTWLMVQQAKEQGDISRPWVPLGEMPTSMPMAVIAAEDQLFFQHRGFDVEAIRKALDHNRRSAHKRGASTISQQVAKNVFLWPQRNFVRKGLEAWFTILIETLWSKERILEVYLNTAETGPGRFGVQATAKACFTLDAAALTPGQCARIAAVLPAPRHYNACNPGPYVLNRQARILRQMGQLGNQMPPGNRPDKRK